MSKKQFKVGDKEISIQKNDGIEWFNLNELAKKFGKNNPTESIRA